jgi:hypothetical protein
MCHPQARKDFNTKEEGEDVERHGVRVASASREAEFNVPALPRPSSREATRSGRGLEGVDLASDVLNTRTCID